jgi:glutamyl-Q tRNA(Asp) synthetase
MKPVGRFAPSPSGPLHLGSVTAALASWLDARAQGGRWLLRIEDVDGPRSQAPAAATITAQLQGLGLHHDGTVRWQSTRSATYARALAGLHQAGLAYPCTCTRSMLSTAAGEQGAASRYAGTCRSGPSRAGAAPSWRAMVGAGVGPDPHVAWHDRRLGPQVQDVAQIVGDFTLRRADGPFAYQLAVVVDDADQGVTHVVRGEDLADNTARQIWLQRALGLPTPEYLHVALVVDPMQRKLSKSQGAAAVETHTPALAMLALQQAALWLGLDDLQEPTETSVSPTRVSDWLARATWAWRARYALR